MGADGVISITMIEIDIDVIAENTFK